MKENGRIYKTKLGTLRLTHGAPRSGMGSVPTRERRNEWSWELSWRLLLTLSAPRSGMERSDAGASVRVVVGAHVEVECAAERDGGRSDAGASERGQSRSDL